MPDSSGCRLPPDAGCQPWEELTSCPNIVACRSRRAGEEAPVSDTDVELGPIDYRTMSSRVEWAVRHPQFDEPMLREHLGQGGRP